MIDARALWDLGGVLSGKATGRHEGYPATYSHKDADGTHWVIMQGSDEPVPATGLVTSEMGEGDSVRVSLDGGSVSILGNASSPSVGEIMARRMSEAAARAMQRRLAASIKVGKDIADQAKRIAEAVGQHVWTADDGLHLTEATEEKFTETPQGRNMLLNAYGFLLREAETWLASFTEGATAFFDGLGNEAANIVARFGRDGAQIGYADAAHVEISQNAMAVSTGNLVTDKRFVAGLANDPITGLATVELFGVLDRVQIISGVEYYAIINDGIEPASFTAIEIDGVSHSVTGLSYSDTAILLDKTEYATYSRSVVKITYATEDPVPTMFYGTSLNASGVNTGPNSAAFGYTSSALGLASFAAGYNADAWGAYSAAIGQNSDAYGRNSVAFGYGAETGVKGTDSIALGYNAKTDAMFAVSVGTGVVAQNLEEIVLGAYNDYASDVNPYGRTQYNNRGKYILVIGNGTADDARSNALAVGWDGTIETARDRDTTTWTDVLSSKSSDINITGFKLVQRGQVVSLWIRFQRTTATSAGAAITVGTLSTAYRPLVEAAAPATTGAGDAYVLESGSVMYRPQSQLAANTNAYVRVTYLVA